MNSDLPWTTVRLEDVAQEVTVGYVGPMIDEYRPTGIPFLRSKNIKPFAIDKEDIRYIDTDFHHKIRKSKLQTGDVVIVRTGAPGTTAVIPSWLGEANCSDLVVVRPSDRLNPSYFSYFMNAVTNHQVDEQTVGAVQQHFNVGSAKQLLVPLPTRKEQDAIVEVLGCLDNRIELNHQTNHTLEAMAQAIFKSWFVDFEPVAAKIDGRKPFGMNDETASLFPLQYEESELGPIPKGWLVTTIGNETTLVPGRSYTSEELQASSVALVTLKSFERGGGYKSDGLKPYTGKYNLDQVIKPGELIIARTDVTQNAEVIGRPAIVKNSSMYSTLVASLDILIARPKSADISTSYLYSLMRTNDCTGHVLGHTNGTTVLHLGKDGIQSYRFAKPPKAVISTFDSIAQPIIDLIDTNESHNYLLSKTRDILLPKLLSGEIRVKQAEKIVEEVA